MFRVSGLTIGGFKGWDYIYGGVNDGMKWNDLQHALKGMGLSYPSSKFARDYTKAKRWHKKWSGIKNTNFNKYIGDDSFAYSPHVGETERMVTFHAEIIDDDGNVIGERDFNIKSPYNMSRKEWLNTGRKLMEQNKSGKVGKIQIRAAYKG